MVYSFGFEQSTEEIILELAAKKGIAPQEVLERALKKYDEREKQREENRRFNLEVLNSERECLFDRT